MRFIRTKLLALCLLFSVLITTSIPVYGVWDKLHVLLEKSKKNDAAKWSAGAVVVGTPDKNVSIIHGWYLP